MQPTNVSSASTGAQAVWGEKGTESQAWLFREFAVELGLDMEQYDADVADPLVGIRVKSDFEEGVELGVDRTPTFFVNDRRITIESFDEAARNAEEFVSLLLQMRTLLPEHGDFINKNDDDQGTLADVYQSVAEREVESKLSLPLPTNMWMNMFIKLLTHTVLKEVKE